MPETLPLEIHSLSLAYFPFDLHRPQSCQVILLSHQLSSKILCWQQVNLGKITKGTSSNIKSKEKGYNKNIKNSILVEGGTELLVLRETFPSKKLNKVTWQPS